MHVPANQTNSWSAFWQHVVNAPCLREMGYTPADCERFRGQAMRCFDRGEPVWMVALELKVLIDNHGTLDRPSYASRKEKSPLQLAVRVVRM